MQTLGTIREFRTAHFRVVVDAVEEFDVDLSWDESGETLRKLESGEYVCFCARARVIHDDLGEIASDYLGGCIYESLEDFQDHIKAAKAQRVENARRRRMKKRQVLIGSYFADMVREVCKEARKRLHAAHAIYARAA